MLAFAHTVTLFIGSFQESVSRFSFRMRKSAAVQRI